MFHKRSMRALLLASFFWCCCFSSNAINGDDSHLYSPEIHLSPDNALDADALLSVESMDFVPQVGTECIADGNFSITDLGDCCYHFEDDTPNPDGANCQSWNISDAAGTPIASLSGGGIDFCFPANGSYVICYTDCCIDPLTGQQTIDEICQTLTVECGCEPAAEFQITDLGDCCYQFDDLTPVPGSNCSNWTILDPLGGIIANGNGSSFTFCFPFSGQFQVCYEDCCFNTDGTQVIAQSCQLLDVDCGCTPDAQFSVTDLGDCCYLFQDLTPLPAGTSCPQVWDIIDPTTGLHLCTGTGSSITCCFPGSGVYDVCYQDCCVDAAGNVITTTYCEPITVDCGSCDPAEVIPTLDIQEDNCVYTFTVQDLGNNNPDELCVIGGPFANPVPLTQATWTIDYSGQCTGWGWCFTVYCCEDDPTNYPTLCVDGVVDCCCEVPAFDWNWVNSAAPCPNGGCAIGFDCPTLADGTLLDASQYCVIWDFGDGTVINGNLGTCPIHCYLDCGIYTACATVYCCDDDTQTLTVCHDVVVDCCCEVPPFDWNWVSSGADICPNGGCAIGFDCPTDLAGNLLDPDEYCVIWDFGDGTVINGDLGVCPIHCYLDCGTYTACATVYCCDDDTQSLTVCHEVVVDCCCEVPDFDWNWVVSQTTPCPDGGCAIGFDCPTDLAGNLLDPNEYCVIWDFGDGTVINGSLNSCPIHCYTDCGTYTVCATVYCCDDDTQSKTVCHDVIVDCCDPCALPTDINFSWGLSSGCANCEDGCCVSFDSGTIWPDDGLCAIWDFGDGSAPHTVLNDFNLFHCFPGSGTYTVCYTVYCCDDPNQSITVCHDVTVDCGGCDLTEIQPSLDIQQDGCVWTFTVLDLGNNNPDDLCVSGEPWGPGVIVPLTQASWTVDFTGECTGWGYCFNVFCCDDPTGAGVGLCVDGIVDCCCDATFTVAQDGCCVTVAGVDNGVCLDAAGLATVDVNGDGVIDLADTQLIIAAGCCSYDMGDGTVYNGPGPFTHCYAQSGLYTICHTVCCWDPITGTLQTETQCLDVDVFCPCNSDDIIPSLDIQTDGCVYTFTVVDLGGNDPNNLCVSGEPFGPGVVVPLTQATWTVDFTGQCTGWGYCFSIFCCDDLDPANAPTICIDGVVNCCCDATFTVTQDECCVTVAGVDNGVCLDAAGLATVDVNGDGVIDLADTQLIIAAGCCTYDMGDGTVYNGPGPFTHCYAQSGLYTICHTVCCWDPLTGTLQTETQCLDVDVLCPQCVLPVGLDFSWGPATNPLCPDGCSIGFDCPVLDPDLYCVHWDFGDGTTYDIPNSCPIHCYSGCGTYTVCLTIYCCDDTTQSITICHDVFVECCTLPFDWFAAVTADDCSACFSPIFEGPCPAECIFWDFGDGTTGSGTFPCHQYPGSGVYNVCMTACCCDNIDAAGNVIDPALCTVICKDITIECCDVDPTFVADPIGDCCYVFADLTPDPNTFPVNNCNIWHVYDVMGNLIATHDGDVFDYCFPESGDYVVCHTDCCFNPDGTITEVTDCQNFWVDCPCPLPVLTNMVHVSSDGCLWGFCIEGDFDLDEHCATWDFGDGTVENHPLNSCPQHQYDCDGNYTVCVTVYCCDDPTISATYCQDIVVDCPCELPQADFAVSVDGCTVTADAFLLSPALCIEDYCVSWDWGDGTTSSGFWGMHTYDADGTYVICMTAYCCEDPNIAYTVCHTVTVDCPCTAPDPFEIQVVTTDNCTFGFCAIGDFDYDEHCVTWDWGDGVVENHPLAFCPVHDYLCDGDYTVCATVYCCDDPTISTTVCVDITVDCPCNLPTNANLLVETDECYIDACVLQAFPTDCPQDYCYSWDFGDGTGIVNGGPCESHTYAGSGTYVVCVTIFCCDEPILPGLTLCDEVEVNCCDLGDPDFNVDINECTACFAPTIDGLPVGSDICYDFHFDWINDPFNGTADPNPCYTYPQSGTYTVCMHIWCCDDLSNIIEVCKEITVECPCDLPSGVDFGVDQNGCTVDVGAIYTDDYNGELCFEWDFGDGSPTVSGESASHTYGDSGHYTICLTIYCCDNPDEFITVCHEVCVICPCTLPQVDIIYDIVNCTAYFGVAGLTADLAGICYDWDFGDGTGGSGTNVNHTYSGSGTYTVCLTVYCCNDLTQSYTICLDITVDCPACVLPSGAGIDCTINECTAAFGAFYTDDYTGPLCFIWDFGDGTPPAFSEVAAHTYFASGTYTVCLYIHCCNDPSEVMSVCKEVTVECDSQCPQPCDLDARFAWTQDPFTFADGCCTHFTDVSVAGASTTITGWSWDFGDGTTSGLQNPTHCYATPGVHTVCLTITGTSPEGDCSDTFCWEVECGCEDTCPGDLDHDGDIDTADLLLLLIGYGGDCP